MKMWTFLVLLLLLPVVYAQDIFVISHITDVVQTDQDGQHLDATNWMWFANNGTEVYREKLRFYVPENTENIEIYSYMAGDQNDLRSYLKLNFDRNRDWISTDLLDENILYPRSPRLFLAMYSLDLDQNTLWKERILHEHVPNSTKFWFKPLDGYEPKSTSTAFFESSVDKGWYESETISPKVGDIYSFSVAQKIEERKNEVSMNQTIANETTKPSRTTGGFAALSSITYALIGGVVILMGIGIALLIKRKRNPWGY